MKFKRGHIYPGLFICSEGPDGSGKTTQFGRKNEYLKNLGYEVVEVREPGGTFIGEKIRKILLDPDNKDEISDYTEMLLFMASRTQLLYQKIIPALKEGKIVSADRFVWSTEAYQGYGAGMSLKNIKKVESAVLDKVYPDLTIVYDVDTDTALKRMSPILRGENLDRIESKGVELQEKVRNGYLNISKENPYNFIVIDSTPSADEIQKKVIFTLEELLVKTGLNKTLTRKSITSKA